MTATTSARAAADDDEILVLELGVDWAAVRQIAVTLLVLAVAAGAGHAIAGPPGVVAGGLLFLAVGFVGAHIKFALERRAALSGKASRRALAPR